MASQDYAVLDGISPSWADITVKLSGSGLVLLEQNDIAAISSSRSVEIGEQRAPGGRVMKRTAGAPSCEASWTLYFEGYQRMLETLLAQAPRRGNEAKISLVPFNIEIQWTPFGSSRIFHRRIKGCRVMGDTIAAAEGTDAQQVEVPLNPLVVADVINGVEVVML
jgi:hypothetical protein